MSIEYDYFSPSHYASQQRHSKIRNQVNQEKPWKTMYLTGISVRKNQNQEPTTNFLVW